MRKPIKEIEIEGDDEAHTITQVAQRLPPQQNSRGQRYRMIDRNYTLEWSNVLRRREIT